MPWRWPNDEFDDVANTITRIKTSIGCSYSFKKKFTKNRKVVEMKIHDLHNLLHDFLLVVVCGSLTLEV